MGIPFGRYELLRKIAAGGMGQVLLARKGAEGFEKLVVIKRILPHLVEDEEFFTMFVDEAKITMRLDHPNIARINEFGVENGVHFIEMEYVQGEDVRRLDRRARTQATPMPLGVVIRIFADAAAGLDFAHKAKDAKGAPLDLVHRDVSPQNILVGFDGSVKLIDFGVAKAMGRAQHTATGILKGKFPYMSPEQADGLEMDGRSDVFALGIVLWEVLTGKRLFKGENDLQSQRMVRACQVQPPSQVEPSLPPALDAVVLKALQKDPKDRYADAAAFRKALEEFALKNAIPTSSADLVEYLQRLCADRIAKEADPRSLEEDSGLTDLDAGGVSAAVLQERSKKSGVGIQHTGQTSAQRGEASTPLASRAGVWIGVGAAVALFVAVAAYFVKTSGEQQHLPLPAVQPVPSTREAQLPPVEPPKPAEILTFSITSDPPGAEIELGGDKKGLTPLEVRVEKLKLPLMLRLNHEGFEMFQTTLTDSSESTVTAALKKRVAVKVKQSDIKTTR